MHIWSTILIALSMATAVELTTVSIQTCEGWSQARWTVCRLYLITQPSQTRLSHWAGPSIRLVAMPERFQAIESVVPIAARLRTTMLETGSD